ncbi:T9SS type A sorting domain-containing protein [Chryseobacterium sp. RP-3-3]|uniref:T9SS type A sorting domain-containing protein n=1 Tax=Chryseobacterium antibioticum TaxID=2728847 RepID=A0A7Y0AMU4_9FLAO|nr:T9SS type A sorting domain-containing protein [Chryseobacterium antibioticum]NML70210.1 T9SS type A sorting domain-containing protein [Chryseobacterium antibioticum]
MKKLLLSAALFSFLIGNAQMNYSFEPAQGFSAGNISGQGGWGGTAAAHVAVVSAEQANPGTQSLKITGNNGTSHTTLAGPISPTTTVNGPIVTVTFNAYLTTAATGDNCDFYFSPQSPTESTINARIRLNFDNTIAVVDMDPFTSAFGYIDTGATFTRNAWNVFKIQLNFTTNVATYYKNGVVFYTGQVVGGTKVGNLAITNDNYNSSAYFDGIQVVSGVLGTSEVEKLNYKMYPNPTSDFVVIESKDKINSIEVYDFGGKKLEAPFVGNKVDLRNLPSGVYILNINTPNGKVTDRIIKK